MDQGQKSEYTEGIEDYLEEYKVYDYFYELMKEIIIHRPKNPIDFLIERISRSETYRSVIIGPPGFSRLGLGKMIASKVGWKYLCMSDWVKKPTVQPVQGDQDEKPRKELKVEGTNEEGKSRQEELDANLLKFRKQVLDSTDDDLDTATLQTKIKGKMHKTLDAGFIPDPEAIELFKKNVKEYEHE